MATEDAIRDTLTSQNEFDSNGESANVVDGLYSISRSLRAVAAALVIPHLKDEKERQYLIQKYFSLKD